MESPGAPKLDLSRTWLLLKITGCARSGRVQRLPMVPMQQPFATSFTLPPEVPSLTGVACEVLLSLGKTMVILADADCVPAVAVTATVLGDGKVAGAW